MYEKTIFIPKLNKKFSYQELASCEYQGVLKMLNSKKGTSDNIAYCTCNGNNLEKSPKLLSKKINESIFILANYPNTNKHNTSCPRYRAEKELMSKGKNNRSTLLESLTDILKYSYSIEELNPKNYKVQDTKYSYLYLLGEYLLATSNNDFASIFKANRTGNRVLPELFEYYKSYCDGLRINPLNNFTVRINSNEILFRDIIFNTKWIPLDENLDKTSTAIKSNIMINKKFSDSDIRLRQYILLKYVDYVEIGDNKVKVTLHAKSSKQEGIPDKIIYINLDKFLFFNKFNAVRIKNQDKKDITEYYVSALVRTLNKELHADDIAFIPTYPNYLIPVENRYEFELIKDVLQYRDELILEKIPKIQNFNSRAQINPDFIITNIETNQKVISEVFTTCSTQYLKELIKTTKKYESFVSETEYEFLGYYKNLGWNKPSLKTLAYGDFKTLTGLHSKVSKSIIQK